MKLSSIKIDPAANQGGVWVGDIPGMGDLRLKVRPWMNTDHRRIRDKLAGAVPNAERLRGMSPETQDKINATCILKAILLDWDGLEGDDGAPLPYSEETAEKLLTEPAYREFRDAVANAAAIAASEGAAGAEADAKN